MNNFIKKLSQREIGFIYIFLGLIIHFLPVIFPVVERVIEKMIYGSALASLFVLSVLSIFKLFLIVTGLIKIFSKTKKVDISIEQNLSNIKEIKYKSIVWMFAGVLLPVIVFFLIPSCKTGEVCHWDIILVLGFFFLIPSLIIGTVFIIIGIIKFNKYLKYKKVQQIIPEEKVK